MSNSCTKFRVSCVSNHKKLNNCVLCFSVQGKSVERLGATVVLVGESYEEAQDYAKMRI